MAKKILMPKDANNQSIQIMALSSPQDVDGSAESAQSDPIDGGIVRICAVGSDIRFLIGLDPTAQITSIFLPANAEIWCPLNVGDRVAVLGGVANITTVGV